MPRNAAWLAWTAVVALGAAGCKDKGTAVKDAAALQEAVAAPSASAPHEPTVHLITSKDHRHVLKLDIGDAIEIPQDSDYDYHPDLKDPTLFRADSATHFTAVKSGPTPLMIDAFPVCHEADAQACGRSRERWVVQLIVR